MKDRRLQRLLAEEATASSEDLWRLVERLNAIGISLTSERNLERLLERILTEARDLTNCDAGSLYTVEDGVLHFQVAQSDTLARRPPAEQPHFDKMTLPLNAESIAGYVALTGETVNVPNVYELPPEAPYRFNQAFVDERFDYRTVSMLGVPLRTRQQEIIGVLQLMNALDAEGRTVPFSPAMEECCRSLASQAAVAFNNARYIEQIKQAQEALIRAEKMAALGRMTAGVSHEVLNPLNIISIRLQTMLASPETSSEMARHFQIMLEQTDRIAKITQGLLYFGRKRTPERVTVNLNDQVQRILALLQRDLGLRNIAVEFTCTDGIPLIAADADQLQQVVLNLLTNARDAMPDGGRLIICTDDVETGAGRCVELRVEDTGVGIPAEHLGKLFDPFFSTKPEGEGTGLGLSICQGIIEAHGGSLTVESATGQGTTFIIHLPLVPLEAPRDG